MRKIVLGVTGSIAAYKALEVLRRFKSEGEDVTCVLTPEAIEFVAPLSFSTLSGNPVITSLFKPRNTPLHIELSAFDLVLVAPCTYNFIGKVASGIADDPLSSTISATKSPVIFVPAMNTNMWENKLLQENINKLKKVGYYFISPDVGKLSTDKIGKGRFPEPDVIVKKVYQIITQVGIIHELPLQDKRIIVTAGSTQEDLDPVRCITNRSSGRMGYEIAKEALTRGGNVVLISGPAEIEVPKGVKFIRVRTTKELAQEVLSQANGAHILIGTAAVADYTPVSYENKKIKADKLTIKLKKTQDILKLVRKKNKKLFIVGFSLETDNLVERAKAKLKEKRLDLIIANSVSSLGGLKTQVTLIDRSLKVKKLPLLSKTDASKQIWDWIIKESK